MEIDLKRRTGRTTRLADEYIQQLFEMGKIDVEDHFQGNVYGDQCLFDRIVKRLEYEHGIYKKDCIKQRFPIIEIDLNSLYKNLKVTKSYKITASPEVIKQLDILFNEYSL